MHKPRNRKERIALIKQKFGLKTAQLFYTSTDSNVKKFVDNQYAYLVSKPDYQDNEAIICKKCGRIIETEFHTHCGCGKDCATY